MAVDVNWAVNNVLDAAGSHVVLKLIPIKVPVKHLLDSHDIHGSSNAEVSQRSNVSSGVWVWSDKHIDFLKLLNVEVRNVVSIALLEVTIDNKHFVFVDLASVFRKLTTVQRWIDNLHEASSTSFDELSSDVSNGVVVVEEDGFINAGLAKLLHHDSCLVWAH